MLSLILALLFFAGICRMLARRGSTKTLQDFKRVAWSPIWPRAAFAKGVRLPVLLAVLIVAIYITV
jgi:hypothetical protein